MNNIKNAFIKILVALLLPFIIVAAFLKRLIFGAPPKDKKYDISADEVLYWLEGMASGATDEECWWGDFLLTHIKNHDLENIRRRCDEVWDKESSYIKFSLEDGCHHLTPEGLKEIKKLIEDCKRIKVNEGEA